MILTYICISFTQARPQSRSRSTLSAGDPGVPERSIIHRTRKTAPFLRHFCAVFRNEICFILPLNYLQKPPPDLVQFLAGLRET